MLRFIGGFLAIIGLVVVCSVMYLLVTREERDRERTGAEDPRARSIRKNHAHMARFINRLLDDEMVYPIIPDDERTTGRELLAEYYDEGATK